MKNSEILICTTMASDLLKLSSLEEIEKQRNKLFLALQTTIIKWLYSILKNKGVFYSEEEIKALSWDCFLFCLKHYKAKKEIPLLNHFFAYTKFFLLIKISESLSYKQGSSEPENYDLSVFEALDDLKSFRKILPEEYKSIFDDTIMSMSEARRDRVRRLGETTVKYYQYCESKKIFKIVIDFLLRR